MRKDHEKKLPPTCSSTFMCFENSFTAWHSWVIDRKPLININELHKARTYFKHILAEKKSPSYFRSSIDLRADVLIIRTAGLPGSVLPSKSSPLHRTSFHDDPKASLICFTKLLSSWTELSGGPRMHLSTKFSNHNKNQINSHEFLKKKDAKNN